jgi:hypothetical protein
VVPWFDSLQGQAGFLFPKVTSTAFCSVGACGSLLAVKRPGRETDHLFPFSAEVKNQWSYRSTCSCAFMTCTGTHLLGKYITARVIKQHAEALSVARKRFGAEVHSEERTYMGMPSDRAAGQTSALKM